MDNPFVFPQGITDEKGHEIRREGGMTLRDYFAGQLLRVLIVDGNGEWDNKAAKQLSAACYRMADVMLAERKRKK